MNDSSLNKKNFEFDFQGKKISFEIDYLANQSEKSILCRYGKTTVLTVLCVKKLEPDNDLNFVPLTINFEERFYSISKIPQVFNKRESKPDYNSVTIARLIDRSVRSFLSLEDQQEIQITNLVLSFDYESDPRLIACWNSILACYLTPSLNSFNKLASTINISKNQKEFIINPNFKQIENSDFELIATFTEEGKIAMVELEAKEISENELIKAINRGWKEAQKIISFFHQIKKSFSPDIKKFSSFQRSMNESLNNKIKSSLKEIIDADYDWNIKKKSFQETLQKIQEEYSSQERRSKIEREWDFTLQELVTENFKKTGLRIDNRRKDDIRPLLIKSNYLPLVDGSALFQRGGTQVLSIATLGKYDERQKIDNIFSNNYKHFIHHYNFPGFSVNEIFGSRAPSRREIGHGQLAEKSFSHVLPTIDDFPYTIRVVSEVLSSDGSSSQASVCATGLALRSAGVPLKNLVAGIALGLLAEEIIVDINAYEDKVGEIDFKMAATKKGICSLQLDVKNQGIFLEIFQKGIKSGLKAIQLILGKMQENSAFISPLLSNQAIKFRKIYVGIEKFGKIVGTRGKNINQLIKDFGVSIDLQPDGYILTYHRDESSLIKVEEFIKKSLKDF